MNTTKTTVKFAATFIAFIAGCLMPAVTAHALPQDGVVVSGGSTITKPNSNTMHINQTTDKAVINWQGYGIGANEAVRYFQPNSNSISLNRVVGRDPSRIFGQLSANGRVWVINPNGLLIGPNARINVGSFLGSTLNITNNDFLAGKYNFKAVSSQLSAISNYGSINANDGGYVVFVSSNISNSGNITANGGNVNMAAGDDITLTFANNGLVNLVINKETAKEALGIENSGRITADGGQVVLSAKVAGDVLKTVINNTGIIEAKTVSKQNGVIRLLGGMENNAIKVGGTLDASAPNGGDGGFIETSAHEVIMNNPVVTAAAPFGKGGQWLVDPTDLTIADATAYNASLDSGTDVTIATAGGGAQAGNLTVATLITKSAGTDATLTLQAHNNIIVNNGVSISSTSNRLNVVFDADSDASGAGNIQMKSGASILTNGGNITFGGGANPATTAAMGSGTNQLLNDIYGIVLSGASLNAGSGNISLRGTGSAGVSNSHGIFAYSGTTIQTTTGAIALNGTGGGNSYNNYGVYLQNSTTKISSASGAISVTGTGGGNGTNSGNYGIYMYSGATIRSTGTATVTLNGTGGSGTDLNYGVYVLDLSTAGTKVTSVDGAISITGTGGGTGGGNNGIYISSGWNPSGASVTATGTASVTLNGTGGNGTNSNTGVNIVAATVSSTSGNINITGTGAGSGISNYGIYIDPSNITSASGNISISASGGNGEKGILTQTNGANNLISGNNVTISANAAAGTTPSLPGTTVTATGTATITNTTPGGSPAPAPAPAPAPSTSGGGSGSGSTGGTTGGTTTLSPAQQYENWEKSRQEAQEVVSNLLSQNSGSRYGTITKKSILSGSGGTALEIPFTLAFGLNFNPYRDNIGEELEDAKKDLAKIEDEGKSEAIRTGREQWNKEHFFDAKPAEYKEPEGAEIFKYLTPEQVLASTKAAVKEYMDVGRWNGVPRSVLEKLNVKYNMARERVRQNEAIRNANARLQYYRKTGFQNAESMSGAKAGDWLK
ncbi:MAG: filamentous hemagglutinin N-terminal domain-containing protein [Nitrospirae bacterium]|nr:MAG: filamentous hemagglutinin N-terminal domain-containing protein [Nitrospirota bacterium]